MAGNRPRQTAIFVQTNWNDIADKPAILTPAEVTFENLDANGDIGSGAAQVAQGNHSHTPAEIGLGNVDNTADTDKPVSTAQQNALDLKANKDNAALTGNPTAPTQLNSDDSTKIANTAFVHALINEILGAAPATLDTLEEIAAAINNDADLYTTLTNLISQKLTKTSNLSDLQDAAAARTNLGLGAVALLANIAISDVTGLQTALDSKEENLISGTNIKTINNISILGSGNIEVTASNNVDGGAAATTYLTVQNLDGGNA